MIEYVADVGNSRIKWGRIAPGGRDFLVTVSLPDDPAAWANCLDDWQVAQSRWLVAGVHPDRCNQLIAWLRQRGQSARLLNEPAELPLAVAVPEPRKVGIDRLLNAVAVAERTPTAHAAVVVNVGTATVVDLVDRDGIYRGGAILPGLRLMAQALHDHTALLPLITVSGPPAEFPGTNTPAALHAGIYYGTAGAIDRLIDEYAEKHEPLTVFLAGGDAERLPPLACGAKPQGPYLTLHGLRRVAGHLS